ncbi:MATE efflux family protein [Treponema primitia ZAS-2]|uniref:MATE efflux family protein n=1 Tax=Treponema primitia (strain ATCC BAA-887 / DSM 12427 / ZAS-2) TaxID=545694 RepID=F5YN84_TREPZ|nr:MATE family efflux transporter [Treponema primitia]AEF85906.1 MATE efflux family protein [Treponema primitia ZAS-2]
MHIRDLFKDKQFYKSLFVISAPIMLQNLVNAFVNMVDTVMIGRLGATEIAAVGLGNQVFFVFSLMLFGICSGGAIFIAQFWGKQDISGIRKNTGLCLILNSAVAIIFTVAVLVDPHRIVGIYSRDPAVVEAGAKYLRTLAPSFIPFGVSFVFIITLRSVEKVRLAMVTTVIALLINVVLNYFFIFGVGPIPAMGVTGAAIATVIARIAEMIILVSVSYAKRYAPAGTLRELTSFSAGFIARFFRITAPVIINETLWSLGITVQNIILGRTHTDAIAAFNITNTFSQLTWVIFMGLGNGVAVLIGKKIGEGKDTAARDYADRITIFAPLTAIAAVFILLPLSRLLPLIFNVNPQVLAHTRAMFVILCCAYPFRAFNMSMVVGICRAGGDTVFCAIYDLIFMWLITLPLAAAASFLFHAPVWLIYLCLCSEEVFKMLLGFWRLKSGRWLHNVTG